MSKDKHQKQAEACEAEARKDAENGVGNESETGNGAAGGEARKEIDAVKGELEEKAKQCAEYLDKLQRTAAEFDNFKKRTAKEKEALYIDAVADVVGSFIPVLDNMERALQAMASDSSAQSLKDGVEMVFKQFREVLKSIGVEEIKSVGQPFDPMLHNAVMHVEEESLGPNVVMEEFQKGYAYKEKVIRYSMVKVAN
jgi:molecular chaperone GrpE